MRIQVAAPPPCVTQSSHACVLSGASPSPASKLLCTSVCGSAPPTCINAPGFFAPAPCAIIEHRASAVYNLISCACVFLQTVLSRYPPDWGRGMAAVSFLWGPNGSSGLWVGLRQLSFYHYPLPIRAPGRPKGTGAPRPWYSLSPQSPPVTTCASPGDSGTAHPPCPKPPPRRRDHVQESVPPLAPTCRRRAWGRGPRRVPVPVTSAPTPFLP